MNLEERIHLIENRNQRVAQDKAWETSRTRRFCIMLVTYIAAALTFKILMPTSNWALSAFVPALGYALSTLSLPHIRSIWEKSFK